MAGYVWRSTRAWDIVAAEDERNIAVGGKWPDDTLKSKPTSISTKDVSTPRSDKVSIDGGIVLLVGCMDPVW